MVTDACLNIATVLNELIQEYVQLSVDSAKYLFITWWAPTKKYDFGIGSQTL